MDCENVRHMLELSSLDTAATAHVESCPACSLRRRVGVAVRGSVLLEAPPELSVRLLSLATREQPATRMDLALRSALVVDAPPDLSARLLQISLQGVPAARPRRWFMGVYAAVTLLLGISIIVADQIYGLALRELGIVEWWQSVAALPGQWLQELYTYFPQGRYVVTAFLSLQRALQWVLVGLLMWAVLEMRMPRRLQMQA